MPAAVVEIPTRTIDSDICTSLAITVCRLPDAVGRWQYDPNSGLYFQLSSGAYYDSKSQQYFKDGKWSATLPE